MSQSHFKMWPLFSTPTAQVSRREVNLPAERAVIEHSIRPFLLILSVFYPQLNSGPFFSSVKPSYWKLHPADFHGCFSPLGLVLTQTDLITPTVWITPTDHDGQDV